MAAYIRFVVSDWINCSTNKPMGVIWAAGLVQHKLSARHRDEVEALFEWFNNFLAIPTRFCKRARSKSGADAIAICWFKDVAKTHIAKTREAARILECYRFRTEMLVEKNPGYVVYEDQDQVAAIPFSRTQR